MALVQSLSIDTGSVGDKLLIFASVTIEISSNKKQENISFCSNFIFFKKIPPSLKTQMGVSECARTFCKSIAIVSPTRQQVDAKRQTGWKDERS